MARPSLKDSLMAALSKGSHIETAEKIARGLPPIPEEEPSTPQETPPIKSNQASNEEELASKEIKKAAKVISVNKNTGEQQVVNDAADTSDGQTVRPSNGMISRRSYSPTVVQSESQTVRPLDGPTAKPSDSQRHLPVQHPAPHTIPQTIPFDVLNISFNQASILEFLLSKTNGLTNYAEIHAATNITMPSARDAMARLVSRGFLSKPQTYRSAAYQGMSFVLNKALCDIFLSAGGLARDRYHTMPHTVKQSDGSTVKPLDSQTDYSSSLDSKATTKTPQTLRPSDGQPVIQSDVYDVGRSDVADIRPSDNFVLIGPEMGYWLDTGLQERQALSWCKEFEIEPAQLRMQLSWARCDLVENKKEEGVQNTINWLYGVLRKTGGCYPRPDNYLSPEERRLRDMESETKRREEARERIRQAEIDLEFQRILDNPEGNAYKELLKKVPKEYSEGKGKIFETFLKKAFFENIGSE